MPTRGRSWERSPATRGTYGTSRSAPRDRSWPPPGTDRTVRLWDVDTGVQRLVLRGHELIVGRVAFSPDGSKLASGPLDGTARVWALDLDDLIKIARRELTRELTEAECRQYLHGACPT